MSAIFETFVSDFHTHATRDANARLICGLADGLGVLPDPSEKAAQAQCQSALALLERARGIARETLSFDEGLDLDLAILMLESESHDYSYRFNGRSKRAQMPKAGDDIGDGIFLLFINDPRPATARLDDITGRLQSVPGFLDAMLARLDTPLARLVSMEVETVTGLPSLFATIEAWALECGYARVAELQAARVAAEAALLSYLGKLQALPTTTQLHLGYPIAREIVALKGIDKSLEELHQIARDFLRETSATIEELRARLVAKYELAPETST